MADDDLVKPSRELLILLGMQIKQAEAQAIADIEKYGYGDKEYERQRWNEYLISVEPLRREQMAVAKTIADYENLKPMPPIIIPRP